MHRAREDGIREKVLVLGGVSAIFVTVFLATALSVTGSARAATTWHVTISGFQFNSANLPITIGDTVIWTNNDGTPHTVTSTDGTGELDSGTILNGGTYEHLFGTLGTFTYRCELHPTMTGLVLVQPVIPEFVTAPFVVLGILGLVVAIVALRRRS